ncbi:MAG: SDR family oxidoreductase [Candidatus Thorarchaeota archaeon]
MRSIQELFSLREKVVIITGGMGLLGKTYAEAIALANGYPVIADIKLNGVEEFLKTLEHETGREGFACEVDITSEKSIQNLVEQTLEKFGRINGLINNAALTVAKGGTEFKNYFSNFENYPLKLWQLALDTNLTGMFLATREIGKKMKKNSDGGSIVNIASTYGVVSPDHRIYQDTKSQYGEQSINTPIGYATTKSAVLNFTRYLATYWAKYKIRVNTLTPGGVFAGHDKTFVDNYSSRVPLGRMAEEHEYQGAMIFLLSDASSYMTGANLIVDGGWTCW